MTSLPRILALDIDMHHEGEKQQSHGDLAIQTDTEGNNRHENNEEATAKESVQKSKV